MQEAKINFFFFFNTFTECRVKTFDLISTQTTPCVRPPPATFMTHVGHNDGLIHVWLWVAYPLKCAYSESSGCTGQAPRLAHTVSQPGQMLAAPGESASRVKSWRRNGALFVHLGFEQLLEIEDEPKIFFFFLNVKTQLRWQVTRKMGNNFLTYYSLKIQFHMQKSGIFEWYLMHGGCRAMDEFSSLQCM